MVTVAYSLFSIPKKSCNNRLEIENTPQTLSKLFITMLVLVEEIFKSD